MDSFLFVTLMTGMILLVIGTMGGLISVYCTPINLRILDAGLRITKVGIVLMLVFIVLVLLGFK